MSLLQAIRKAGAQGPLSLREAPGPLSLRWAPGPLSVRGAPGPLSLWERVRVRAPTRSPRRGPAGFTLIELLVVIAILGILAGITLGALSVSRESARVEKTRATVAKLNHVVMQLYSEYRYRRVPLSDDQIKTIAQAWFGYNPAPGIPPSTKWVAAIRLAALRDIMRMEMPERRSDMYAPGTNNWRGSFVPGLSLPSVHQAYASRAMAMANNAPAECLYMIVTLAGGEEARQQFSDDEIADTDGNGLPEFIDGWGRPIYWLRWAPGFNVSDLQPNLPMDSSPASLDLRQQASQQDHDPFDPRRVELAVGPLDALKNPPRGWRLVPLVYSAGRDGIYGLSEELQIGVYVWANDTYLQNWGLPIHPGHYDNIHNHRLEAR